MRTFTKTIIAATALLLAAGASQATTVDFESVPPVAGNGLYFGAIYSPIVTQGFSFTTESNFTFHGHLITDPNTCVTGCASNGTLYVGGDMANLVMTAVGGGGFAVSSFDAAKAFFGLARPDTVVVDGHVVGGGSVTQTFNLAANGFSTYAVSGFSNVDSVTFRGADSNGRPDNLWIGVDNIDTAPPVPEPETYAMLLAGLGALGMLARRRG